jgi:hypothetical protein
VNRAVERGARNNPEMAFNLPPLDKITPALGPVLSVYWSDPDGFHAKETGPFPLAAALSPGQMMFLRVSEMMQARRNGPALP